MFCPAFSDNILADELNLKPHKKVTFDLNHNLTNNNNLNCNDCDKKHEFDYRRKESEDLLKRFPNKIPIVVEKYRNERYLGDLDKGKWLVPEDMTVLQLHLILQHKLGVPKSKELFILVNGRSIPSPSMSLSYVYSNHSAPDGRLYLTYSSQECYG